jgi:hypothetical protein
VALVAALTLAFGLVTAMGLASVDDWRRAVFFGVLVPMLAVGDWLWVRRRKGTATASADHMALTMLFLVVCMAYLATR